MNISPPTWASETSKDRSGSEEAEPLPTCKHCGRLLNNIDDPLSNDCGDIDCWGCISEIEADMLGVDVSEYRDEQWAKARSLKLENVAAHAAKREALDGG